MLAANTNNCSQPAPALPARLPTRLLARCTIQCSTVTAVDQTWHVLLLCACNSTVRQSGIQHSAVLQARAQVTATAQQSVSDVSCFSERAVAMHQAEPARFAPSHAFQRAVAREAVPSLARMTELCEHPPCSRGRSRETESFPPRLNSGTGSFVHAIASTLIHWSVVQPA